MWRVGVIKEACSCTTVGMLQEVKDEVQREGKREIKRERGMRKEVREMLQEEEVGCVAGASEMI